MAVSACPPAFNFLIKIYNREQMSPASIGGGGHLSLQRRCNPPLKP